MAIKKIYGGSTVGPLIYNDALALDDPDGDFAGVDFHALVTDGQLWVEQVPVLDEEVLRLADISTLIAPAVGGMFKNVFYPDSSAADQGATADGAYTTSVELINSIGSSEKAVVVFRHTGASDTTVYTFKDDVTASVAFPANITVIIEPGAVLTENTGDTVTLTIVGPFIAVREKCFDWTNGSVYFASTIENSKTGVVFPEWWGAIPDGDSTRDDLAFQKASNSFHGFGGVVDMDQGVYHFEASVKPGMGVVFQGKGYHVPPFEAARDPVNLEAGTWIWIDATGFSPFDLESGGQTFRDFGMAWLHDAPGGGWAPTQYEAAFYLDETNGVDGANDVKFYNIMMLNPYIGISQPYVNGTSLGRLEIDHLFGQPFYQGLNIQNMSDVCRISNVHFWPYWSANSNVQDWTKANGRAIAIERMDQPEFNNIFALSYLVGFYFDEESNGSFSTYGCQINNANLDHCKYGIYVETTDINGLNVNLNNSYISGGTPITDSRGIYVAGSNTHIRVNNSQMLNIGEEFVAIGGSGNYFSADNIYWNGWNFDNGAHGSMNITAGNYGYFGSQRVITGGQNGAAVSYGAGTIIKDGEGLGAWSGSTANQTGDTTLASGTAAADLWIGVYLDTDVGAAGSTGEVVITDTTASRAAKAQVHQSYIKWASCSLWIKNGSAYTVTYTHGAGTVRTGVNIIPVSHWKHPYN